MQCSRTESLNVFFNEVQVSYVPKIAIIGCGCSTATEPVAEISHYWNISQVVNPRRAYSRSTGYEAAYERYQQLEGYESMKIKKAIFLKRLRSRDMA